MSYCTSTDVRRLLPDAVVIEGENTTPSITNPRPESIKIVEIDWYIEQADSIINAKLAAIYDIPLRKSNIGGLIKYPDPIPWTSAALTTYLIMTQRLSAGDRAESSKYVIDLYTRAQEVLDHVLNGNIRLMNQNSYTSHRTVKSDLFSIPPGVSKEQSQTK
mgnify:FL=1|jgi:hypothetical protein